MHVGTLGRRLLAIVSLAAACSNRHSLPRGTCGTSNHEGLYFSLGCARARQEGVAGSRWGIFLSGWSPKGCRRHLGVVRAYLRANTTEFADPGFQSRGRWGY